MKSKIYFITTLCIMGLWANAQVITDIDGNTYNTVTIGAQNWMQENLKTTRFNNGVPLPTTSSPVSNDTTALYQWAYDEDTNNINIYGRLYTWNVTNSQYNICPVGWKVPDNSDWDLLMDFLGGELVAGGKMKEIGTTHWLVSDSTVTNSSGFTGLGSGFRGNPSGFTNIGQSGSFWSSTPTGTLVFPRGNVYRLSSNNNILLNSVAVAQNGLCIRCIEDKTISIENLPFQNSIQIYPNPATDRVVISLQEVRNNKLSIYDMMGNSLHEQKLVDKKNHIEIDTLPQGIYLIHISSGNHTVLYKFIKQ